ncbi:hypothetical protein ACFPRL_25875 [Pseudoclavibacter helvolus]
MGEACTFRSGVGVVTPRPPPVSRGWRLCSLSRGWRRLGPT